MRRWGGLALLAWGCSASEPSAAPISSALPPGVVARTGAELVAAETVRRIAERQAISAQAASELAVTDALLAAEARARLADGTVRSIRRAGHARALLEELSREAKAQPAPTDAELAEVRSERWVDLDRPDAVRTTHAVVLNDEPARAAEARLVAEKLVAALSGVTTGEELIRVARAFPSEGFKLQAEPLPFVTTDGRTFARTEMGMVARPGGFDADFARGVNAMTEVGQLGPIIESSFGFHVVLLEERLPGVSTPPASLATLLGPEVLARRGSKLRRQLLDKLRAGTPIEVERAADDLTAKVPVSP